jgi:hypothetical protein
MSKASLASLVLVEMCLGDGRKGVRCDKGAGRCCGRGTYHPVSVEHVELRFLRHYSPIPQDGSEYGTNSFTILAHHSREEVINEAKAWQTRADSRRNNTQSVAEGVGATRGYCNATARKCGVSRAIINHLKKATSSSCSDANFPERTGADDAALAPAIP